MAKAEEISALDCDKSIRGGALLVLGSRLQEMCALRASALDFTDIEGVHDMRVASRRLRSALRDFAPFLRRKAIPQRRLKALADALGEVRDEDVAIEALEKLQVKAPKEIAAGIEQFVNVRRRKRARARQALENMLAEDALHAMRLKYLSRFEHALRPDAKSATERRSGEAVSFRQAGREIISARFQELGELASSLHHPFEVDPLHRMRIAAKRLRYAIELFASCGGNDLLALAKEIAALQSSLGELHDCDVWIADLGVRLDEYASEQPSADGQPIDKRQQARQAGVWLMGHFVKERESHFRAALVRWHKWETKNFAGRLAKSLEPGPATMGHSAQALAPELEATGAPPLAPAHAQLP